MPDDALQPPQKPSPRHREKSFDLPDGNTPECGRCHQHLDFPRIFATQKPELQTPDKSQSRPMTAKTCAAFPATKLPGHHEEKAQNAAPAGGLSAKHESFDDAEHPSCEHQSRAAALHELLALPAVNPRPSFLSPTPFAIPSKDFLLPRRGASWPW